MDQVSMSQEEVDYLSNIKKPSADTEAVEEAQRQEITEVLGDKFPVDSGNSAAPAAIADAEEPAAQEPPVEKNEDEDADDEGDWLDVLGSGALKKKVLKAGISEQKPEHGTRVTIRYHTFLMDDTCVEGPVDATITCGDCDIVQAFDMALMLMTEGELALIETSSRFAYKDQERIVKRASKEDAVIPAESKLRFEVLLKEIHATPQHSSVSMEWIMDECEIKRKRGNELFRIADYGQAIWSYKKALEWLDNDDKAKKIKSPTAEIREMTVSVWNNVAQAYIKLQQWTEALDACQRALKIEPDNVKALYRAAKVHEEKKNFTECIKVLAKANTVDPSNKTVSTMLNDIRQRHNAQREKEKAMYRRMVSGTSSSAAASSSSSTSESSPSSSASSKPDKKDSVTSATVTLYAGAAIVATVAMCAAFYLVR